MSRSLLVIGGGRLRSPAVRFAREAGLRAVVADSDLQAPARRAAHEYHPVPADDVDSLVALARALMRAGGLAGVWAAEERALHALSAIGVATGVPAPSPDAVERALDRAHARELWQKRGLPAAEGGGALVLVQGFFRDGAFAPAGVLDRFSAASPPDLVEWSALPSALSEAEAREAFALVDRGARALGIAVGPIEALLVRGPGGLALAELAPCLKDEVTASFVAPLALGKSPIQAWFAALADAGGPFDAMPSAGSSCAGWMAILPDGPGVLEGVEGLEQARAMPGIADVFVHDQGRAIPSLSDERAVCGWIWGQAPDRLALEYRLRSAREVLSVRVAWPRAA